MWSERLFMILIHRSLVSYALILDLILIILIFSVTISDGCLERHQRILGPVVR